MATKIPADAKKVFERDLFAVYEKDTLQFDGSHKIFERVRSYDVAKAICVVEDKIVILATEMPGISLYYSIPGGIIDPGESADECIRREVTEETGITFEEFSPLSVATSNVGLVEAYKHYYLARKPISFGEQHLDPGGERLSVEYITFDEFIDYIKEGKAFGDLGIWFMRTYLLPWKIEELRMLLFGK